MSFSNTVKGELASAITDKDRKYACLYGILLFCKQIAENGICLQTESAIVEQMFRSLVSDIFKGSVKLSLDKTQKSNGSVLYTFWIRDGEQVKIVLDTLRIDCACREIDLTNIDNNNIGIFIAGAFLSCGSVTDPNKEYHLEFVAPTQQLYIDLSTLLKSVGLSSKMVQRKNSYVVYMKESENIEDMLTFMGAQQCTLEMINVKILKDMRNRINRIANCDVANYGKTVEAAIKQKQDIELIERTMGLENLPVPLRDIAYARLENPELSLKELGEILDEPIGRSGVNHRLKRIAEIAAQLKENT